jgi:hypothetical protein
VRKQSTFFTSEMKLHEPQYEIFEQLPNGAVLRAVVPGLIEVLSTTRRPQASGFDSFRVKRPVPGSISSRRWIVFASRPVVSASRFAARPVGAHSASASSYLE